MSAVKLIERLDRVTLIGTDRWRAICPSHKSKNHSQSLSVRETSDGIVLIKCFFGCGATDVVAAVGLQFGDLFPARDVHQGGPQRPNHWHATRAAVATLNHEVIVVAVAADRIASGKPVSEEDANRVALAAGRLRAALAACA